ncbi:ABC transporter permease [Caldicellulosiruptor sp. DIB 104C]|uniref:ABC transporter permease n=1 Tax=Caldicellulosiruptor sp. DIB 104C TaxID=3019889 RepID=UPI00230540CD|nr:ABC transporter permease subunit [Caldicellulosiruptor sp. DIB 104C]
MTTFKAYFKKEFIEGIRQYKYIALATGIILFSILDPIMLKLLPTFVSNKIPANLIHKLFEFKTKDALANYIKDLFQIGTLFVIFTAAGSINEEIYSQKIVFPLTKGASKSQIVMAKFLHFLVAVCFFLFVGLFLNRYYANLLFEGQKIAISDTILVYFLLCIYYLFVISITLLFSSFTKKNISAGILACAASFSTALLSQFEKLKKFSPYNLILLTNSVDLQDAKIAMLITVFLTLIFLVTTISRFNNLELN